MKGLGSEEFQGETFLYNEGYEVARSVARAAPRPIRDRIWPAGDLQMLRDRVDTLGEGVRDYDAATPVVPGTWCFVGAKRLSIVLSVDPEGRPIAGLGAASQAPVIEMIDPADVRAVWTPSVEPRRYTGASHPVWEELDMALGALRVRGEAKAEAAEPLFLDTDMHGLMAGESAKALRRGPDELEGWPAYLDEIGQLSDAAPQPGDLLLLGDDLQAIALDGGEMAVGRGGSLAIRPLTGKARRWRPRR
jgi:hypothetical protein